MPLVVHQSVVDAISGQMISPTANLGGIYPSALNTIQGVARAREAAAAFFNCQPWEVVFGANMTSLTMHVARSLSINLSASDNVVVTMLDHDANCTPWEKVAEEIGATVNRVNFNSTDCLLDLAHMEQVVDKNTKLVAVNAAANSCGSLTDIQRVVQIVKEKSKGLALVYVDAVHFAPHKLIDVEELGCDFLACSAYKFSGPHAGMLYGKADVLKQLGPFKLTASTNLLPGPHSSQSNRWENGTQSFEALAGIKASIEYLGSIGVRSGLATSKDSLRDRLIAAFVAINTHEDEICKLFLQEAAMISGLSILGVTDIEKVSLRTATFALQFEGLSPEEFAAQLVKRGIACGAGHFYALYFPKMLGLDGFTRIGFYHYHTISDVKKVLYALKDISATQSL